MGEGTPSPTSQQSGVCHHSHPVWGSYSPAPGAPALGEAWALLILGYAKGTSQPAGCDDVVALAPERHWLLALFPSCLEKPWGLDETHRQHLHHEWGWDIQVPQGEAML